MTTDTVTFPAQFSDFDRFADWAMPSLAERRNKRLSSTQDQINDFFGTVAPRIDEILGHLNQYPLEEVPAELAGLRDLILTLAEIGPYAEWFEGMPESAITVGNAGRVEVLVEPA